MIMFANPTANAHFDCLVIQDISILSTFYTGSLYCVSRFAGPIFVIIIRYFFFYRLLGTNFREKTCMSIKLIQLTITNGFIYGDMRIHKIMKNDLTQN